MPASAPPRSLFLPSSTPFRLLSSLTTRVTLGYGNGFHTYALILKWETIKPSGK